MTTADLIERLAADLKPVSRGLLARRLALSLGAGAALSAAIMLSWLGPRPDIALALGSFSYWMKFAYTLGLGLAGFAAAARLARPIGQAAGAASAIALLLAGIATLAALQMATAPTPEWPRMMMGATADRCPWRIVVLSLPLLAAALLAMRAFAPTRLTLAGTAAGLVAGGFGAFIYAFACDETAAPFVAIWYSAGIFATAALGAILGRPLLRW
jgi:hypothetical protein